MTTEPDPQANAGLVRSVADACTRVLATLPPAFLVLVALNVAFLAMILWWLDAQLDIRAQLLGRIIDHCLTR